MKKLFLIFGLFLFTQLGYSQTDWSTKTVPLIHIPERNTATFMIYPKSTVQWYFVQNDLYDNRNEFFPPIATIGGGGLASAENFAGSFEFGLIPKNKTFESSIWFVEFRAGIELEDRSFYMMPLVGYQEGWNRNNLSSQWLGLLFGSELSNFIKKDTRLNVLLEVRGRVYTRNFLPGIEGVVGPRTHSVDIGLAVAYRLVGKN